MTDNTNENIEFIYVRRRDLSTSEIQGGPPIWLISFTDVIALMLTFFVLMYAMSDPEPAKWEDKLQQNKVGYAQYGGGKNHAGNDEGRNISRIDYAKAENLDYLQAVLDEVTKNYDAYHFASMQRSGNDLIVEFDSGIFDGRQFTREFLLYMNALTPVIKSLNNRISLVSSGSDASNFNNLQRLGNVLKGYGYSKPFVLQVNDNGNSNTTFAISIQPHDGRRITR